MFCTQCGKRNLDRAQFCFACGSPFGQRPVETIVSETESVAPPQPHVGPQNVAGRLRFHGYGSDIFSAAGFKMVLWFISIVGMPVALMYAMRWNVGSVALPDGRRLVFGGSTRDLYRYFGAYVGVAVINQLCSSGLALFAEESPVLVDAASVALYIGYFAAISWLSWLIYRWICANVSIHGTETRVAFVGRPGAFVGWNVLSGMAMFSVIGWAWAYAAFYRWMVRNIRVPRRSLTFHGSGLSILWRIPVVVAGSVLLLPLPWLVVWLHRWLIGNIQIEPTNAASPPPLPPDRSATSPGGGRAVLVGVTLVALAALSLLGMQSRSVVEAGGGLYSAHSMRSSFGLGVDQEPHVLHQVRRRGGTA